MKAARMCLLVLLISFVGCGSEPISQPITARQPNISISPVSATAGSSDLVLNVTGTNFANQQHDQSVVVWSANGSNTFLQTTVTSSTELTAVIPAALMASPVTAKVSVQTGDPLASFPLSTSDSVIFTVTAISPGSTAISAISPMSAAAGSPDLTLIVTGSNFANQNHEKSVVVWSVNGTDTRLQTTFDSSTQLTAVIPAHLLTTPVTARVLVETGDPVSSVPPSQSNFINFSVTP
jgi:IPT/TIG domain